jgi:hypothetical protein
LLDYFTVFGDFRPLESGENVFTPFLIVILRVPLSSSYVGFNKFVSDDYGVIDTFFFGLFDPN